MHDEMLKPAYDHVPDKSNGRWKQQIDFSYDLVLTLSISLLNDL